MANQFLTNIFCLSLDI